MGAVIAAVSKDRVDNVPLLLQPLFVLYGYGVNILDSNQHSDPVAGQFFQRLRFDMSELQADRATMERAVNEVAGRFAMRYRLLYANRPKRVAIYVSKYDHCLYDLLLRHLRVTRLLISGVASDQCIAMSAAEAKMRDYDVVVASDCIADQTPARTARALRHLHEAHGIATTRSARLRLPARRRAPGR